MRHHRLGGGPVTAPGGGRGSPRPMHTQTDRRDPAAAGGAQHGCCLPASPPGSPRLVLPVPSLPARSPSPSWQKGDRESQRCWLGDAGLRSPTASRSLVVLPPCSMREPKPRVQPSLTWVMLLPGSSTVAPQPHCPHQQEQSPTGTRISPTPTSWSLSRQAPCHPAGLPVLQATLLYI